MRIFLQKLFTIKKILLYSAVLVVLFATPTAFVFAGGSSSSGPGVLAATMTFLMMPFHYLMTAAGSLMGVTMYYTVVRMGYYVHQLSSIQIAWELFRDLGNIFIVFGFIAIGIATILDNATYGAKKALPKLLIIAILLNFSLFFTEFIVDTGNVFATQFYSSISGGHLPSSASTFSVSKEPISGSIMTVLKTTGLYNKKAPSLGAGETIELGVFSIIMFIIMAFAFFAIAIMLISRFVILLFLFIVSPIGFIGLAGIPLISDYGKKWWKALTNQTVLAPILFLFLLVVTKMIQSNFMQKLTGSGTLASAVSNTNVTPMANMLMAFSVVIGLLFVSLITAKSLSGKAAEFAINQSRKRIAQAFSVPIGASARLLRGSAQIIAGKDSKFSKGVGHLMRPIERANFDVVGKLGGKRFLGMGEAKGTSYRDWAARGVFGKEGFVRKPLREIKEKNLAEMDVEERERQKRQAEDDTKKANKEKEKAQKEKLSAETEMQDLEKKQKSNPEPIAEYEGKRTAVQDKIDAADVRVESANKTISNSIAKLSVAEIAKLDEIRKGVGTLSQSLSPERFAQLMKSDSLTEQRKSILRSKRYEPIAQAIASGNASTIRNQSTRDLEQYAEYAPEKFRTVGAMLSNSQADALQKSGSLNTVQIRELKKIRGERFNTTEGARGAMEGMGLREIAKLPTQTFVKPTTLEAISYRTIRGLLDEPGDLSPDAQEALTKHVTEEMQNGTDKGIKLRGFMEGDKRAANRWGIAQPTP